MKPTIRSLLFFSLFALLAIHASAQTTSIVADRIRAAEYWRVGNNTSQKITGFSTTIPAVPTDFTLPTTKALHDYVVSSFMPLGAAAGGDLSGTYPNPIVRALQGYSISATAPTLNKVLKWNGLAWAPADDATGSSYTAGDGISIASNIITNTGDLSATNELNTSFSVSRSNLALTDAGGTINVPVSSIAPVQAVAAGSGISISGTTTRTFTAADVSPTNELQTLSISGSDLTLSNGGGTVTLPGGGASDALGTGFTDGGGSGSVPDDTEIHWSNTYNNYMKFTNSGAIGLEFHMGNDVGIGYDQEYAAIKFYDRAIPDVGIVKSLIASNNVALGTGFTAGAGLGQIPNNTIAESNFLTYPVLLSWHDDIDFDGLPFIGFRARNNDSGSTANIGFFQQDGSAEPATIIGCEIVNTGFKFNLIFNENGISVTAGNGLGLQYVADYSATIATSDRSVPDVGTLKAGLIPNINRQVDDATALNGETFYSTNRSKLCYKDPGGTVNELY